ncbi:MAG TPA: MraY family glycosyltransferase [Candidatus Saccharimonadales bacterium]|nr:MraY family glycosyltransferase [Candidatus Saccharimonadales bacterium]
MQSITMLYPFLVAFLVTAISTPILIPLIKKLGFVDDPKTHKHPALLHTKPIPRGGGIPLFLGIFVGGIFFLPISKITIALFLSSLLALVIGTLDDKYDISRYLRFGINILCALIVVSAGVGIPFITNPFGGILHLDAVRVTFTFFGRHTIYLLSDFLALLWIVWAMNMLNWSKGVDGQMPGVVGISAIVIGILSLRFSLLDPQTIISSHLSFLIAGAAFGFLLYNFHPAKIFPGYGATSIYLLLSVVAILSGAKLATAALVMGVPMIDGFFTIVRRMVSGKSPFWHDRGHLHHQLLRLGYSQRGIALFYYIVSAILGAASLTLSSTGKLFAILMLVVIAGGALLFLYNTIEQEDEQKTL